MREIWLIGFFAILLVVGVVNRFSYDQTGIASWYGPGFNGKMTSNGETYDMNAMTAAHKTLPFNTLVKVIDLDTGRSVIVRINDRGPFVPGRIIDLSLAAAKALGSDKKGIAHVGLKVVHWPDQK
ncbi:septal ring lytic transglycosylase RlpA family protein [Candidatus Acetothermia bacterium]|nr:septal ring lytic transglycosylase RlpA family protein [Candidatus Acetothermia bacterium]MBI3642849.1 septal ring lytic transglycosylase RlpA family protein [Candidatus Acetothermia bacterium]